MWSCSTARYNVENTKKLGWLVSVLSKWPKYALATRPLELCYLKQQTSLPKIKWKFT